MKIFIFTAFLTILLNINIQAQEKNTDISLHHKVLIGGNIDLEIYQSVSAEFKICPMAGYFISPKIAIGLQLGYYYFDEIPYELNKYAYRETPDYITVSGNSYSFAPFVMFQNRIGGNFFYNIKASFGYESSGKLEVVEYPDLENSFYKRLYTNVDVGISYFFSNTLAINLRLLDFEFSKISEDILYENDQTSTKFKYNFIEPNIGISFYL